MILLFFLFPILLLLDKDFITMDKNAYSVYDQFFSLWLAFKGMI